MRTEGDSGEEGGERNQGEVRREGKGKMRREGLVVVVRRAHVRAVLLVLR